MCRGKSINVAESIIVMDVNRLLHIFENKDNQNMHANIRDTEQVEIQSSRLTTMKMTDSVDRPYSSAFCIIKTTDLQLFRHSCQFPTYKNDDLHHLIIKFVQGISRCYDGKLA